jgi:hypothetical protein
LIGADFVTSPGVLLSRSSDPYPPSGPQISNASGDPIRSILKIRLGHEFRSNPNAFRHILGGQSFAPTGAMFLRSLEVPDCPFVNLNVASDDQFLAAIHTRFDPCTGALVEAVFSFSDDAFEPLLTNCVEHVRRRCFDVIGNANLGRTELQEKGGPDCLNQPRVYYTTFGSGT